MPAAGAAGTIRGWEPSNYGLVVDNVNVSVLL
jgi:hypothetical protein